MVKFFVKDGDRQMTLSEYCTEKKINMDMIHKRIHYRKLHKTDAEEVWFDSAKDILILYANQLRKPPRKPKGL